MRQRTSPRVLRSRYSKRHRQRIEKLAKANALKETKSYIKNSLTEDKENLKKNYIHAVKAKKNYQENNYGVTKQTETARKEDNAGLTKARSARQTDTTSQQGPNVQSLEVTRDSVPFWSNLGTESRKRSATEDPVYCENIWPPKVRLSIYRLIPTR